MAAPTTAVSINAEMWKGIQYAVLQYQQNILGRPNMVAFDQNGQISSGTKFNWILEDYISSLEMTNVLETTEIDVQYPTQRHVEGVVLRRSIAFGESMVRIMKNGTRKTIRQKIARELQALLATNYQLDLASAIKGAFAAASASALQVDISGEGGADGEINRKNIRAAISDQFPNKDDSYMKYLIVHADAYEDLMKSISGGYNTQDILISQIGLPMIGGLQIIKNSQITQKIDNEDDTYDYTSYIVSDFPFMINNQEIPNMESERKILKGQGTDIYAINTAYAVAPRFASYTGSATDSPTRTAFETGTNWSWVYTDREDVPMIELRTLGGVTA